MNGSRLLSLIILCGAGLGFFAQPARAQDAAPAEQPEAAMVRVDLPQNLELRYLIELVSERLRINIVYDPIVVAGKTINVRAPSEVTEGSLLTLLDNALRLHGLALVEMEHQPGWRKVVQSMTLQSFAEPAATQPIGEGVAQAGLPATPVAQVFTLRFADPARVADLVRPFLTTPGGNVVALPGQRQVAVTDFGTVVERIAKVIQLVDVRDPDMRVEVVPLVWSEAQSLSSTISNILQNEMTMTMGAQPSAFVAADERSNQLILVGKAPRVTELAEMAKRLDQPQNLETRVYRFKAIGAEQADKLFRDVMAPAVAGGLYRAAFDRNQGALVVAAPIALHEQLRSIVDQLDVPAPESPIQFYKLKNTVAEDVLETIAGLAEEDEGEAPLGAVTPTPGGAGDVTMPIDVPGEVEATTPVSPIVSTPQFGTRNQAAIAQAQGAQRAVAGMRGPAQALDDPNLDAETQTGQITTFDRPGRRDSARIDYVNDRDRGAGGAGAGPRAVRSRNAIVTSDRNTNSIIVIGAPPVQAMYAELIRQLDQRRPQVLVEVTMLTLDTSNGFTLGVEISDSSSVNDGSLLTFSAFGLSEVDPETGQLTPIPGVGGNVALLGPDMANVVIQALATNTRSQLISMPQILVNDNEDGLLDSVLEVPFAQRNELNTGGASTTVGGVASAGTKITVTPHISEGDYLQLEYSVELSSFTGTAEPNLPPPIQTNEIESVVTIPDGHTIVVGGLKLKNNTAGINAVPILGQIPILEYLFSSRNISDNETTLFVFIKPVILRDDQFKDLKYYSGRKLDAGELEGDFPRSEPLLIR